MARRTRSASIMRRESGTGFILYLVPFCSHFTSSTSAPATFPFPVNLTVERLQCLSQPSSCEVDVLRIFPKKGHGLSGVRDSGGFGRISIWVTLAAFCLMAVPIQSEPVSPPPITRTFFPVAQSSLRSEGSYPEFILFCRLRKSIAKCIPLSSRPSMFKSRGLPEPIAIHTAS